RDQDALGAGGDHVLDGGDLTLIVGVKLARGAQEFGALGRSLLVCAFLHLDEERVAFGLGDQADLDLPAGSSRGCRRAGRRRRGRRRSASGGKQERRDGQAGEVSRTNAHEAVLPGVRGWLSTPRPTLPSR